MNESPSVYQLVTRLCVSLIQESDENLEGFTVNSAKRIAFEEILRNHKSDDPADDELENLIIELQFASFELSLANRNKDSRQVNEYIEVVKEKPKAYENISSLLVKLKNIDPENGEGKVRKENVVYWMFVEVTGRVRDIISLKFGEIKFIFREDLNIPDFDIPLKSFKLLFTSKFNISYLSNFH
jgi:hypothetical protein